MVPAFLSPRSEADNAAVVRGLRGNTALRSLALIGGSLDGTSAGERVVEIRKRQRRAAFQSVRCCALLLPRTADFAGRRPRLG